MKAFFSIILVFLILACESNQKERPTGFKSENPKEEVVEPTTNKDVEIEFTIFDNTEVENEIEINGFGYDIYLNGKHYVHQPTIPAISGNQGFKTKEQAQRVAELVVHKIRNNILPPSVSIAELDSLNALE